jgi:hypothetical protein
MRVWIRPDFSPANKSRQNYRVLAPGTLLETLASDHSWLELHGQVSGGRSRDAGDDAGDLMLAKREGAFQFSAKEEPMSERNQEDIGEIVLQVVRDQRPHDARLGGGLNVMAVMPVGEWSADLSIAEALVPLEFGDLGEPLDAVRRPGKGKKAERDA